MFTAIQDGTGFQVHDRHAVLSVEAWGQQAVRVRVVPDAAPRPDHGALLARPQPSADVSLTLAETTATLQVGHLTVHAAWTSGAGNGYLLLTFAHRGQEVLREEPEHFWWPGPHGVYPAGEGSEVHQTFAAYPDERLFGLGQYSHGLLDHKGAVLDLVQRNGEVSIPFVLSSRGYGMLWNNPAVGRVEFGATRTRWVGHGTDVIDYWLTVGDEPKDILAAYAAAVGRPPELPAWASGFWQSRLRYTSQTELLEVAREYRRRGLPLAVIVSDFLHWPAMGDYQFDPAEYPDPRAMLAELEELGVQLMVSVWPTVSPLSANYLQMRDAGLLVGTHQGVEFHQTFKDKGMPTALPVAFYDPTNPRTQAYIWDKIKQGYHDLGVRVFWLDACEPELNPGHPGNLRFFTGTGWQVANTFPRDNARFFAAGLAEAGTPSTVLLCRSAWAGQARYGAAVWSGDIAPTWQALAAQVTAGQSIAIAGIAWWTSDIGGFHGGDPTDPAYQELFIRWFQFGAFCPLFRLHGHREPREQVGGVAPGGANEVWSYGPVAYDIAATYLHLREKLRPYLHQVMAEAARTGIPPMRSLFLEFPADPAAWEHPQQFLLGSDLLVCPVLAPGITELDVYLPAGARWRDPATGQMYDGGATVRVPAPLERIPVLIREGSPLTW
ncbi:glycoside hydrolase family 31 protein [Buchananella hordeovulneris]|uniref:glycoside hydrolase family 31 protein n=1 Tax=Buchananella hordeovulneris TaxID=52770 RepID=UPI0026DC3AD9|nr:TIM-barrel domain-containing protein [Buchananella hordeovulneris]MDO5080655.1 glycoside hydrolase family 31 protein [Buchananella hordeovulneris]